MKTQEIKLKDVPILMPDGVEVKIGMIVFDIEMTRCGSDNDVKRYPGSYGVKRYSGKSRYKIIHGKVISVNHAANSRSFTLRSKRGCETTYSVKDSCLPEDLCGKLATIKGIKKKKDYNDAHAAEDRISDKIERLEILRGDIKNERDLMKKLKSIK